MGNVRSNNVLKDIVNSLSLYKAKRNLGRVGSSERDEMVMDRKCSWKCSQDRMRSFSSCIRDPLSSEILCLQRSSVFLELQSALARASDVENLYVGFHAGLKVTNRTNDAKKSS
nr:hypothetical protein [Tanacetum cinerariifolium]